VLRGFPVPVPADPGAAANIQHNMVLGLMFLPVEELRVMECPHPGCPAGMVGDGPAWAWRREMRRHFRATHTWRRWLTPRRLLRRWAQ
jgi:hypothetical protein